MAIVELLGGLIAGALLLAAIRTLVNSKRTNRVNTVSLQ